MNVLSREKQIEVIAALCEGVGIRTASRLTGVNRGTVASLALRVGLGCGAECYDRARPYSLRPPTNSRGCYSLGD